MASHVKYNGGAATIDHQEVHVDMTNTGKPSSDRTVINSQSGVGYDSEPGAAVVIQKPPDAKDKPKDFVVTSCVTILLCNFIFGLLGYHYGVKANHAWQLGDEVECRRHRKKALMFVIAAVIAGVITYALAITLYFTLSSSDFY